MRKGRHVYNPVPIRVVAPIVREWNDRYIANKGEPARNSYIENHGNEAGLEVLGFQSGISPKTLRAIMNNKLKGGNTSHGGGYYVDDISFDMADKIVCATLGPLGWLTDPTLSRYYGPLDVTFGELEKGYELPEGFDFDSLPQPKKYMWHKARLMKEMAA